MDLKYGKIALTLDDYKHGLILRETAINRIYDIFKED